MKKVWKWILGIVIALIVVAAVGFIVRGVFISRTNRLSNFQPPLTKNFDPGDRRTPSFDSDKFNNPRDNFNRRLPMQSERGFHGHGYLGYGFWPFPFILFGGLFKFIFLFVILGVVVYFSYSMGKKAGAAEVLASVPGTKSEPELPPKKKRA